MVVTAFLLTAPDVRVSAGVDRQIEIEAKNVLRDRELTMT